MDVYVSKGYAEITLHLLAFEIVTVALHLSDTMVSAVLANPTRALQATNRGSGPAMEESENDVGSLEQILLYADEHYLAGKLPLGDHLGNDYD
ncbi:15-hydroxyprostaglandin dehydrogenase [Trichonephila clavipes]|nr:15-hydroxyprostaglandin dehydrogenase [Trichonephila clavipes]